MNHLFKGKGMKWELKLGIDFEFSLTATDWEGEKIEGLELFFYYWVHKWDYLTYASTHAHSILSAWVYGAIPLLQELFLCHSN